jgi:hypothetical protein
MFWTLDIPFKTGFTVCISAKMFERFFLHFQIAPSAKKLWGVEEQKDDPKGILNLNDHQMWRDSTWSTSGE